MKVAIYARISTNEQRQDLQNQLDQLRDYCRRMEWEIAGEYTDAISGTTDKRPGLEKMMHAAARKAFDAVVVWKLDRLTRGGPAKAFAYIARLNAMRVQFYSMTEEMFRTTGPAGELMIAIAAHIAEMERTTIQQRVKAGIERARRNGGDHGRPAKVVDQAVINRLRKQGKSIRNIAAALKVSKSTIERRLEP